LLEFVQEAQIDRAGCFAYSPVEGAGANALDGALPDAVRHERQQTFMQVASEVAANKQAARVGDIVQVLVDQAIGLGKKGGVGRSYAEAPEVDGVISLLPVDKASKTYRAGEFVKAMIVESNGHDLSAKVI